jgi:hypothetical protein
MVVQVFPLLSKENLDYQKPSMVVLNDCIMMIEDVIFFDLIVRLHVLDVCDVDLHDHMQVRVH